MGTVVLVLAFIGLIDVGKFLYHLGLAFYVFCVAEDNP